MSTENEESTESIEYNMEIIELKFPLPKICCSCCFFFLSLTITVHCLLDWIWTQLGNISPGVSMRVLSKRFNWELEPWPECEQHHHRDQGPKWIKRGKFIDSDEKQHSSFLLCDCRPDKQPRFQAILPSPWWSLQTQSQNEAALKYTHPVFYHNSEIPHTVKQV